MFSDKVDGEIMAWLWGMLGLLWILFSFFSVWYRPENGNRNFTWVRDIDTVFFWGNTALWSIVFCALMLTLIDIGIFRFFYFICFLISAFLGPWLGWWVAYFIYVEDYITNGDAYPATDVFLHLFLLGCWNLAMVFLAIDTIGPLWRWYEKKA